MVDVMKILMETYLHQLGIEAEVITRPIKDIQAENKTEETTETA